MVESFENLDTIYMTGQKIMMQKILIEAMNRYEKQDLYLDFPVQSCFCSKFSFHEKRQSYTLTEALFSGANHKSLLCIATRGQRLFELCFVMI